MSRELLQQALDALETKYSDYIYDGAGSAIAGAFEDDVAALRAALAQPAPAVQVVLRQPNLFAADPAAPAVNCEWTNCPRRVGDVCCNDRPAAPAVPAVDCRTCARCYSTKGRGVYGCDSVVACSNGDRYQPLPVVQLWRAA